MNDNITASVKYIGADDLDIDLFESQYVVPEGISYNSYIIMDEKIAVMDTIDMRKAEEWKNNLRKALDGKKPDYLVVQHMEPDHAANIGWFAQEYPEATMWGLLPAKGFFIRHARGVELDNVTVRTAAPDARPKVVRVDAR